MADIAPSTAHPDHDTILVAALAAGDLADIARADAEALVAACSDCAALHADLVAIAAATKALPAPVRTRDFRLTPAQAERLRPSGPRRWLAAFASPRLAVTRPLAATFTTLGLVGLLLTAVPAAGPLGVFSGAAQREVSDAGQTIDLDADGAGAEALPSPDPDGAAGSPAVPGIAQGPGPSLVPSPDGSPAGDDIAGEQKDELVASDDLGSSGAGVPVLGLLSIGLLMIGVGLFALRFAARRTSAG